MTIIRYSESELLILKRQRSFRRFHYFIFFEFIPLMQGVASFAGLAFCALFLLGKMTLADFQFSIFAAGIWVALFPWAKNKIPHRRFLRWHRRTALQMHRRRIA